LIVLIEQIVEVREGRNSDGFNRYSYKAVEEQSFSLLVEGERQGKIVEWLAYFMGLIYFIWASWQYICSVTIT